MDVCLSVVVWRADTTDDTLSVVTVYPSQTLSYPPLLFFFVCLGGKGGGE